MILVFDLDDTLYHEITYVYSGFAAVARFISQHWQLQFETVQQQLIDTLQQYGRGQVFNRVLREYGVTSATAARQCLRVYRSHTPDIRLHTEGQACLQRFSDSVKYLVTDGNKLVQQRKVNALGIEQEFRRVMITHRFGVAHAKPSAYCFLKIAEAEKSPHANIVYIGDNPAKDFVGIKPYGFRTIRVLTGEHRHVRKPTEYEAHMTVASLDEITTDIIAQVQAI